MTQNTPENSSSAGVSRKSRRKEKLSPVVSSTSIDQEGSLFSGWFGGASNTASLSTTPPKRIVSGVEMTTGSLNATANSSSRNPLSSASGSFRDRVVHRKKSESDVEADVAAALADLNGPKTSSLSAALISGSPSTSGSVSVEETQQQ